MFVDTIDFDFTRYQDELDQAEAFESFIEDTFEESPSALTHPYDTDEIVWRVYQGDLTPRALRTLMDDNARRLLVRLQEEDLSWNDYD